MITIACALIGEWIDVPREAVVHGPNRADRTIVWPYYKDGYSKARCFMPGSKAEASAGHWRMFQKSIRQKIIGISAGLIILAVITSVLSIVLTSRVGHLLDEVTSKYIPAYGDLARVNIRSLERSLALRRMIIAKMHSPPDEAGYAASLKTFE